MVKGLSWKHEQVLARASKSAKRNRNIGVAVSVILILIIASIAAFYFGKNSLFINNGQSSSPITSISAPTSTPLRAVLKVDGSVTNGYWKRDTATDLPDYESTISYSVTDVGNRDASSVNISIGAGGNIYPYNIIPSITMSNSYSSSFSYSTPNGQTNTILIQANCQDSSDSYTLSIGSTFPRDWVFDTYTNQIVEPNSPSLQPSTVELFVTPNQQSVVAMKDSILKSKLFIEPDWTALWEWVGSKIKYNFASESAETSGGTANWQFPFETLQSREGLCVDYSILLCSLYRDGVFGPNDVYVVLGTNGQHDSTGNPIYHAWVIVRLPIVGWYALDPQGTGNFIVNLVVNPFQVSGYTGQYEFNDQQFLAISS